MPRRLGIQVTDDPDAPTAPTLSKSKQDQVRWFAHGKGFTIVFDGKGPFFDKTFHVPADGSVHSGPVRSDVEPGQAFEYEVKGPAGMSADPKVFVED